MATTPAGKWVAIAWIRRARGLRGQLVVSSLGSSEERILALKKVYLAHAQGEPQPVEVEQAEKIHGELVLQLAGINNRSAAEQLTGAELWLPVEERPLLPDGEYYHSDLVGCQVLKGDGSVLGLVTGVDDTGPQTILQVQSQDGEILIPFVRALCRSIDPAARKIIVDLPEGLEELNRPDSRPERWE